MLSEFYDRLGYAITGLSVLLKFECRVSTLAALGWLLFGPALRSSGQTVPSLAHGLFLFSWLPLNNLHTHIKGENALA